MPVNEGTGDQYAKVFSGIEGKFVLNRYTIRLVPAFLLLVFRNSRIAIA